MGRVAQKVQISNLGSIDSLSLAENIEEFKEGDESSVQLISLYLDF